MTKFCYASFHHQFLVFVKQIRITLGVDVGRSIAQGFIVMQTFAFSSQLKTASEMTNVVAAGALNSITELEIWRRVGMLFLF